MDPAKGGGAGGKPRTHGTLLQRLMHRLTGAPIPDAPDEALHWRDYGADILGWIAVAALVAALIYLAIAGFTAFRN